MTPRNRPGRGAKPRLRVAHAYGNPYLRVWECFTPGAYPRIFSAPTPKEAYMSWARGQLRSARHVPFTDQPHPSGLLNVP